MEVAELISNLYAKVEATQGALHAHRVFAAALVSSLPADTADRLRAIWPTLQGDALVTLRSLESTNRRGDQTSPGCQVGGLKGEWNAMQQLLGEVSR